LAKYHALGCADGDRAECKGDCSHKAGTYLSREYARCPVAEVMDDGRLAFVMSLDRAERAGFGLGQAHEWAAWVPALLAEYRGAVADRMHSAKGT
jgi:hypothetical protein